MGVLVDKTRAYSHDINYMVAYPLIFGELTSQS